mgnify:CR=1 FL=1
MRRVGVMAGVRDVTPSCNRTHQLRWDECQGGAGQRGAGFGMVPDTLQAPLAVHHSIRAVFGDTPPGMHVWIRCDHLHRQSRDKAAQLVAKVK